jgi:hypothetical protein
MRTPVVTEITRRFEPVVHDTFIDDLRSPRPEPPSELRPSRPR